MQIELFVGGEPRAQMRPRTFKAGRKTVTWSPKSPWYHAVCAQTLKARPKKPLEGPLDVHLLFFFALPMRGKMKGEYVTKRPDLDNLAKPVMDALTAAKWWDDDAQVVNMRQRKVYDVGRGPGVEIIVSPSCILTP